MKLEILEQSERKITLLLEDADVSLVNALRRIILSEIPVLAIEYVDFVENSSGLYDEVLANRLGLIPLIFPKKMNIKKDCKCNGKGCSNCQIYISLDAEGPCMVKSSDLKIDHDSVKSLSQDIPIVELLEGQKIKLEAIAELGVGGEHSKWQAGVAGYRNYPIVRTQSAKGSMEPALKACPKGVFAKKGDGISVVKTINCDLCMRCTEVTDAVSVSADETKFIFMFESVCGLTAKELFDCALDVLEQKAKEFKSAVKSEL